MDSIILLCGQTKNWLDNSQLKREPNQTALIASPLEFWRCSIADIICYLPVSMVSLRTLKSEVAVGLKPEVIKKVAKSDSSWLTNGQWGVISLVV